MYSQSLSERQGEAIAMTVGDAMFSPEERVVYAKVIKDFNELYYKCDRQTWCQTVWRGINVLKPPTDLWIYQELISRHRPELIIETGTLRGGSAVFLSDINRLMNPNGHVVTIDINPNNLDPKALESDVDFWTGSSIDALVIERLKTLILKRDYQTVMVILDSNHTEAHVTKELELYSPIVTIGMPLIVEDGGNCYSVEVAIEKWLKINPHFEQDFECEKFMLTFNRFGYLEKLRDKP